MIQEHEIPKYKKSKKSNISKSNHKSKHKHQYEECLIQYDSTFVGKIIRHTRLTGYCTICGKIGSVKNGKCEIELEQLRKERQGDSKFCVFISSEEIYERIKDKTIWILARINGKKMQCVTERDGVCAFISELSIPFH